MAGTLKQIKSINFFLNLFLLAQNCQGCINLKMNKKEITGKGTKTKKGWMNNFKAVISYYDLNSKL